MDNGTMKPPRIAYIAVDLDRAILNMDAEGDLQPELAGFPPERRPICRGDVEHRGKDSTCEADYGHGSSTGTEDAGTMWPRFRRNCVDLAIRVATG
jgi:hypothetical protein